MHVWNVCLLEEWSKQTSNDRRTTLGLLTV